MPTVLTKDAILNAKTSTSFEDVLVDEIADGAVIRLAVMSGHQRDKYEAMITSRTDKNGRLTESKGLKAALVVMCAVGEDGVRLFDDEDVDKLNGLSAVVIERLFDAACRINAIGEAATEVARGN